MPGMTGVFDASKIEPKQGGGAHPVGNKFQFTITDTSIEPAKDNKSGMLVVEFSSQQGTIQKRYSLWHENATTVRIAQEQLSALCHAVGIFQIQFDNDCAALRGGIGLMDVGFQKGHEPSAEKPAGGYVEIKKIYDKNGNEPGHAGQAQPQQGWSAGPTQNPAPPPNPNPPAQQQPQWGGNTPASGWSQQPAAAGQPQNPPWGPR